MGTKTQTTYHKVRMFAGQQTEQRGPNCETLELARRCNVPGEEIAYVKTDWRLGGDGAWHETNATIVEWEVL